MNLAEQEYLEAPVKITKLSDAIRIGARLRPKCTGHYFSGGGSCALGAAYEAITGKTDAASSSDVSSLSLFAVMFDDYQWWSVIGRKVYRMNDSTKTDNRLEIADYLESEGL